MSERYQIIERCDRCGAEETISYDDSEALAQHSTTLVRVYLGAKMLPVTGDICAMCIHAFRAWWERSQ